MRIVRFLISFSIAVVFVGALMIVGVNLYFKRDTFTPVEAFIVDPADPLLLERLRLADSGMAEPEDAPEPEFEWPERQRRGFVQLEFTVQPDGRASGIHVVGAQPAGYYEEQAKANVAGRRFVPAYVDGKPVTSTRTQIVDFKFTPPSD